MLEGSGPNDSTRDSRRFTGWIVGLTALGVVTRLVALLLAGDLEPYADESNYLYLALCWNRFSVYSDSALYLWPPGYPFFLAVFLRVLGAEGVFAAKLCQVLLDAVVGATIMLLARRLFKRAAALVAGILWCGYVPLIGFTHYLWPETLFLAVFLPGLYLFVDWWLESATGCATGRKLMTAGLLIGLSLLIKEVGLWWCAVLCALILWRDCRQSIVGAVARSALFMLSVMVVVLPWTLRNVEVYGRYAPVGATLGQNVYFGMNGFYANFDYPPAMNRKLGRRPNWFSRPADEIWARSPALNIIDRSAENAARGLQFARERPMYMLRTRVKKLADWATPLSFFIRHCAMDIYGGALSKGGLRRLLIIAALIMPMLVMGGAIPGFFWALQVPGARTLVGWSLLYFVPVTALINGMSRYRIVIEPLLIVLAAGFVVRLARVLRGREKVAFPIAACGGAWLVLVLLWLINVEESTTMIREAW